MASHFRFKKASEVLSSMTDYILTHTNKINDFTEGSVVQTLLESFSTEIEMYYYLNVENIKLGIWNSIYTSFGFSRKPELKAYGTVNIVFNNETSGTTVISKGTKFTSSNSLYPQVFETLDEFNIDSGTTETTITVYCTQGGEYGNVPAGVIDTVGNLANISSVYNDEAFQTGREEESLEDVRRRFRGFIQAIQRGTVQAIQFGAMNVPNVDSAYVVDSPGIVNVYVNDANGDLPDELRIAVQNEMYYWSSVGIPITILPIHKTMVDLDIIVDVPNPALKNDALLNEIGVKLSRYINKFKAGQHLYTNDLVQKVMDISDDGIKDAQVNVKINPDAAIRGDLAVSDLNSIIINSHLYPHKIYEPSDRTVDENYIVSNPEDLDNSQYANLPDGEGGNSTTSTTTSTTLNNENNLESNTSDINYSNKNTIANFVLTTPDNNGIADNPYFVNPLTVASDNSSNSFDYLMSDKTTIGQVTDTTGTSINSYRTKNVDGSKLSIAYTSDVNVMTLDYTPYDSETSSYGPVDTKVVNLGDDIIFHDYEVSVSSSLIYIRDTINNNRTSFSKKTNTLSHTNSDNYVTTIVYNPSDNTKKYTATTQVDSQVKTIYVYDNEAVVASSKTIVISLSGNRTETSFDGKGNTTMTNTYGPDGVLITSVDGNGQSLITTTTTTMYPYTTSTTTEPASTTTTTTTTTIYPFEKPAPVSGSDATGDGYLPVFGEYLTSYNELLKAGNISINFEEGD